MELLALFAFGLMFGIGWIIETKCFGKWIPQDSRFYFAPGIGMGVCAVVAYVACHTRKTWLVPLFVLCAVIVFVRSALRKKLRGIDDIDARRVFRFTLLAFLCLYLMQTSIFYLFKGIYPGPTELWDIFNATAVPPPDQMFAWHQAMFADHHRHYPRDPFFDDMDLYDRPHLGGYLTLFFFKLFHLPLAEDHWVYPVYALRFYHCFWWALNNCYLFGIAPLFRHLFGYRGATLAVASTAVSGFVLLSNLGGWMKFSSLYLFVLAVILFLTGKSPVLQALFCASSFYLHGSILPFLLGFGLLQILCIYFPIRPALARLSEVAWFGIVGVITVGGWFLVVRWVGSKQPLFYFYLYNAGLTEAQTRPVGDLAKAFYAKHTWSSLSFLPLRNLARNFWPSDFFGFLQNILVSTPTWRIQDLGSVLFRSQQFCVLAAGGLVALPVVLVGAMKNLSIRYAGGVMLTLYLIPTLLIGLIYRLPWAYLLHIICIYHTFVLFFWVSVLRNARLRFRILALAAVALEGVICVLFADVRFLPVHGIQVSQLTVDGLSYLLAYLSFLLVILSGAYLTMRSTSPEVGALGQQHIALTQHWFSISRRLLVGLLIVALTIASYSLFCLQFYRSE